MVSPSASTYELDVAGRLCINPYEPLPTAFNVPYVEQGQQQSIVLPIILVILAIVFCLGCVVGIPVIAFLYKQRNENKDFTDLNQIPYPENEEDAVIASSNVSKSKSRKTAEDDTRGPDSNIIGIEGLPEGEDSSRGN